MTVPAPKSAVLIRLASAADRAAAEAAISAAHPVTVEDPAVLPEADPDAWAAAGYGVAVLDYDGEDAASVKLLQRAAEAPGAPRMVFVLGSDAPFDRGQLLMAMNEGAWAVLPGPVEGPALAHGVERALSGTVHARGTMRVETDSPYDNAHHAALEETVRRLRGQSAAYERLISRLLSTPASAQARRVLIVSDSVFQREQLEKTLQEFGFAVFTASTPAAGLATALREKPRTVVSDLEMDDFDGIEFCRRLKIENKFVPCYFLICTANKDRIPQVLAPGNGVDDCLPKPSGPGDVLTFVARVAMGILL